MHFMTMRRLFVCITKASIPRGKLDFVPFLLHGKFLSIIFQYAFFIHKLMLYPAAFISSQSHVS